MTLDTQFMTMFVMVLSGFYLGIALETFYRFKPFWKKNVFLSYFMEILFWTSQTVILFYVLFRVNGGELRFYIIAACLLGFAIYQVVAAKLYKKLLEYIIRVIAAIYHFFERLIQLLLINPIKWIISMLIALVLWLIHLIGIILLFSLKVVFFPIRGLLKMIYSLLPKKIQSFLLNIAGFCSTMKNITTKWIHFIWSKRR